MKRFITYFLMFMTLTAVALSQASSFKNGFGTSTYTAGVGDIGNTLTVQSEWTDGATLQPYGMYSWSFDVTSTDATIKGSIVPTLHSSISSNFNLTTTSITNGLRVSISGKSTSKYLVDAGTASVTDIALYNTVVITFNAPSSAGTATVVIANNASGVKRSTTGTHSPVAQTVATNGKLVCTITTTLPQTVVVPPTFSVAGVKSGAPRLYGDVNWDGGVDITDITGLKAVVDSNYTAVQVQATTTRAFYSGDASNKQSDSTVSDISAPNGFDLLDVAVLEDAVLNAEWSTVARVSVAGKPLQKADGAHSILCEISKEGTANARIRFSIVSGDAVDGLQVFIPATGLNKAVSGTPLVSANFSVKYNYYEKIVALLYPQQSGKALQTEAGVMVLNIPYVTVDKFINANPEFTLSISGESVRAGYKVETSSMSFIPDAYELAQNYPNPFNPSTTIKYDVPMNSNVSIAVYNSIGVQVATLVHAYNPAGTYNVQWNATSLSSGMYYIRMSAGKFTKTIKAILLK